MRINKWLGVGFMLGTLGCGGIAEDDPPQEVDVQDEMQQQAIGTAVTQSFQDGVAPTASYRGTADTMLAQSAPTQSFGQATELRVDGDDPYTSGKHKYAALRWDLSAIPVGSTVQSASITLNVKDPTSQTYTLYRVFAPWAEAATTWNSFVATARGTTSRGTVSPRATGLQTFRLNGNGVALMNEWVKDPKSNAGLVIVNDLAWDGLAFDSREVATAARRPKLTVTYVPPSTGGGTGGTGGTDSTGGGTDGGGTSGGGTGSGSSTFLYDDFNGSLFSLTSDGLTTPNGLWRAGYVSQGFVKTVQDAANSANRYLVMAPKLDVLRAARLDSTKTWKGIHGRMRARLDAQLQPAISWYTFWPFIAYVDETTHYYFNLKTNGWELGKKDNDHPPVEELQEYLRTGSSPKATVGQWVTLEWWVVKDTASSNLRIRVDVDGVKVVDMVDNQAWQRNGTTGIGTSAKFLNADKRVTLYSEASQVSWDDIYVEEATSIP